MQQSSLYSLVTGPIERPLQRRSQRVVAGSKSLAAMLPTMLSTGIVSLVAAAVMRLLWIGAGHDFMAAWMEAWLTVWPIAFPAAYISKPLINSLTRRLSKSVPAEAALGIGAVMLASEQATAKAGLKRKPAPNVVQR